MPLHFTSSSELKIDVKNRIFIPAEVRKTIDPTSAGAAVYVILGPNRVPWLYPDKSYDELLARIPMSMTPDPDLQDLVHSRFAMSHRIAWDEQGRIVLPEMILKQAGIEKEVTLAGCGDHLELWNRAAWDAHCRDVWARIQAIGSKLAETAKIGKATT